MPRWRLRRPRRTGTLIAAGVVFVVWLVLSFLGWLGTAQTVMAEWRGDGALAPVISALLPLLTSAYFASTMLAAVAILLLLNMVIPLPDRFDVGSTLASLSPMARQLMSEVIIEGWISVIMPRADEPTWRTPPTVYRPYARDMTVTVDPVQRQRELDALRVELVDRGLVVDEKGDGKVYCPTLNGWEVTQVLARQEQLEIEGAHRKLSDVEFALLRAMEGASAHTKDLPAYLRDATGMRDWTMVEFTACWLNIPQAFRNHERGLAALGRKYIRARTIAERQTSEG